MLRKLTLHNNLVSKGMFLCSAVSSIYDCSKYWIHFTLHQTCSFQRHLDFSGKNSGSLQLLHEDNLFTYPSVARHSFIQLSELWQRGVNEIAKTSNSSKKIRTRGFSFGGPTFKARCHRAPGTVQNNTEDSA